jgi:predicted phospho-2-dehydro-3-deoxyheptonate aldolase
MSGKRLRLKRIVSHADGRSVILPLDHGVTMGPIAGIERIDATIEAGVRGGADALILHKGMLRCLESATGRLPAVIMHLSASTELGPSCYRKVLVGSVEEAVRRGADAVSFHINFGDSHESEMLTDLGAVGRSCADWQVPLLVMAYTCGDRISAPATGKQVAHAARVAAELGADIIKIPFPGDFEMLARISSSLSVPIVVAGGPSVKLENILERIEKGLEAGARGVAAGRNVFQQDDPQAVLRAICDIVHRGVSAKEALDRLKA